VELRRPELTNPEWKDKDGNGTGKGLVGEALKLGVSCNEDVEEGAGVIFKVYPEEADAEQDRPVAELASVNKEGKAEAEWTYRYKHDPENPLKEKPKFYFTATAKRCKEAKSGNVEIGQYIYIQMLTPNSIIVNRAKGTLVTGSTPQEITISDGYYEKQDQIPGDWRFYLGTIENNTDKNSVFDKAGEAHYVIRKSRDVLEQDGIAIPEGRKKLEIIIDREGLSL
jgi:hypothetical protein